MGPRVRGERLTWSSAAYDLDNRLNGDLENKDRDVDHGQDVDEPAVHHGFLARVTGTGAGGARPVHVTVEREIGPMKSEPEVVLGANTELDS